jgi:hypothetical protein
MPSQNAQEKKPGFNFRAMATQLLFETRVIVLFYMNTI